MLDLTQHNLMHGAQCLVAKVFGLLGYFRGLEAGSRLAQKADCQSHISPEYCGHSEFAKGLNHSDHKRMRGLTLQKPSCGPFKV